MRRASGTRPFLISDGHELTYQISICRSSGLAMALLAEGIGKGDHVGSSCPTASNGPSPGSRRRGSVPSPFHSNTFYTASELAWTARHADLRAILTWSTFRNHDFVERLEEALSGLADQRDPGRITLRKTPYLRTIAVWGPCDRGWATTLPEDDTRVGF